MVECSSVFFFFFWISVTLSYLISFIISFIIVANRVSTREFVFYLSKIATMKNIVKINHNSKIFDHFDSDGELVGITTKYNRLLELTTIDGCKEGYKKCGVLDTIGNTLCIDNNFGCPINRITVDLLANRGKHNFKGMKEVYNENLIYNYKFYYSNESLGGNNIVSLLFTDEEPKYITSNNFIVDLAAYKDNYNEDLNNNNNNRKDNGMEFGENLINIIVSDNYLESILKASFTLYNLIADADNDKEKFKDYVEEQLETEENDIDKYYINVGENAYIKNYIGFKTLDDINKFFNFDYNIYKYNYPTKTAYRLALAAGILGVIFFLIFSMVFCAFLDKAYEDKKEMKTERENENDNNKKANDVQISQGDDTIIDMKVDDLNKNNNENAIKDNINNENNENKENNKNNDDTSLSKKNGKKNLKENIKENINACCSNCKCRKSYWVQLVVSLGFIGINVALLAYSAWVLYKNHKNKKKLNKLREINSDDFIKGFLNEFRKKCEISSLIIPAIALLGSSIVLHLIGIIIFIIVFSSGILF